MNGTAVIAAAHAIERTTAFRKRFHDGPDPPGANVHDAAVEFARAALAAQLIDHAEHDARIVAVERERCAQLADGIRCLLTSGPIGRESGERYIRADLIRAVLDEHAQEGTTDAATA